MKKLAMILSLTMILSLYPIQVQAKLTSDTDCTTFTTKDSGDDSGEQMKVMIDNDGMNLHVKVTTRNQNQYYAVMIYKGYTWIAKSTGTFSGKEFETDIDISKLYSTSGTYLLRLNFGASEDQVTGEPYTFGGIKLVSDKTKVVFEKYSAIEQKNKAVKQKGSKVLTENYLDTYMTDSYETDYGEGMTKAKVKVMTNLAKNLATKSSAATDYDKALAFHDFIGHNYEYDWSGHAELNPYKLYQRYLNGGTLKTICNGYAAYFVMLCRCVGIPARTVKGKSISLEKESWSDYSGTGMTCDHVWAEAYLDTDGNGTKEWTTFDCDGDSITRGWQYTYANPSLQALSVTRMYMSYRETDGTYIKPVIKDISSVSSGVKLSWTAGYVKAAGRTLTYAQQHNVKAYVIYRGTSSTNLKKIKTVTTTRNQMSYVDKTGKKGVKYYYKVAAVAKTDGLEGRPGLYRTIVRK